MHRISTEARRRAAQPAAALRAAHIAVVLAAFSVLTGCATRKDALLPHGNATMLDVWNAQTGGAVNGAQSGQTLLQARTALRRPLTDEETAAALTGPVSYARTAENGTNRQFERLPDPDLVMYVFPHLAGLDPVPVPGYVTVFSFYGRVHYAMPGDRTADF